MNWEWNVRESNKDSLKVPLKITWFLFKSAPHVSPGARDANSSECDKSSRARHPASPLSAAEASWQALAKLLFMVCLPKWWEILGWHLKRHEFLKFPTLLDSLCILSKFSLSRQKSKIEFYAIRLRNQSFCQRSALTWEQKENFDVLTSDSTTRCQFRKW